MKTPEYNHGNNWLDKLLNSYPFLLDTEDVDTLFSFAYCKDAGVWKWQAGNDTSMFNNGTLFVRYTITPLTPVWASFVFLLCFFVSLWCLPLFLYGLFVHISAAETGEDRFWQFGVGHKLNGRFGALFRFQSDESAAAGAHDNAPNHGHANGWECGNK